MYFLPLRLDMRHRERELCLHYLTLMNNFSVASLSSCYFIFVGSQGLVPSGGTFTEPVLAGVWAMVSYSDMSILKTDTKLYIFMGYKRWFDSCTYTMYNVKISVNISVSNCHCFMKAVILLLFSLNNILKMYSHVLYNNSILCYLTITHWSMYVFLSSSFLIPSGVW